MSGVATQKDRYGLSLSTSSARAAQRYEEGVDLALSLNTGTEEIKVRRRPGSAGTGWDECTRRLLPLFRQPCAPHCRSRPCSYLWATL